MRCVLLATFLSFVLGTDSFAADWPQFGGTPSRNNVPQGNDIPAEWDVGQFEPNTNRWLRDSAKNIRWVARLGSTTYGTPVIADGKVFCGANNGAGWLKQFPSKVDLGCLLCFQRDTGRFLWQLSAAKLAAGRLLDYPGQGICATPLVEGKRLWIVTNRCEVVCLDTEGFQDGKNDGRVASEPNAERDDADVLWSFDMIKELGVTPYSMSACSVTSAGDLLFVNTSNGADPKRSLVVSPEAPSFIALDKHTGKLIWADNSPGGNILEGQWASPAYAMLGGVPQVLFPGGDGWIYSFRAEPTTTGKPELLWKFDANGKQSIWKEDGSGDRESLVATPVVHDGRVYIATGADPEFGEGLGRLWCIDPTKRGDVSPELVLDKAGQPVLPTRGRAIDPATEASIQKNPNSAAVWGYTTFDQNGDGQLDFTETMHRSLSMAVIKDDLLVIADLSGLVHCLDAKTGKVHWTYDLLSQVWGSPCIVDGKIYIGNQDGDVVVFKLAAELTVLAKNAMLNPVYSTPVEADDVLYISTSTHLFAISKTE